VKMRLKCEEPGDVVYTITTTATAREWEEFRTALDELAMKSLGPLDKVHAFRRQIDELLGQARKIYWAAEDDPTSLLSTEK